MKMTLLALIKSDLARIVEPTALNALRQYLMPRGETFPFVVWFRLLQYVRRSRILRFIFGPIVYWRCRVLEHKYGVHANSNINIGPGLHIVHGSCHLNAEKIGKNFTVRQFVTIGEHNGGRPIIGDNVTVNPGAVVVGPIRLGDGCTIGALSYVSHDVPNGTVVKGVW